MAASFIASLLIHVSHDQQHDRPTGRVVESYPAISRFGSAEIAKLEVKLLGYDRLCAAADVAMPAPVRDYCFENLRNRVGTSEQFAVWRDAADTLRADPQASIEIAEPAAPPHVPSKSVQVPHVAAVPAKDQAKAAGAR